MTVNELIKELEKLPKDKNVFVGCQGYTSINEYDISLKVKNHKTGVYILDNCFYEGITKP